MLANKVNTNIIKKNKKVKIDLSQIKYFNCHKKGYYINKYNEKQSKNYCQSWQSLNK